MAGDVDVTDTGRVSRRKGYTQKVSGVSAHSGFCDGGDCLFVTGTDLCILNPDYTYKSIATVKDGARVSYAQINNKIYFCNGYEKGIVEDQIFKAWEKGAYVGQPTKRTLSDPPVGTIVAYYRGRVYVVQNNVLWYSEEFAFGAFDLARGFIPFSGDIRMVQPVDDGIFISTDTQTFFLSGQSPLQFELVKVADYPAIKGSDCKLQGRAVSGEYGGTSIIEGNGNAVLWLSNLGVCYGGPGGNFKNLTLDRVDNFPTGLTGSGLVYNGRYIGLIDP